MTKCTLVARAAMKDGLDAGKQVHLVSGEEVLSNGHRWAGVHCRLTLAQTPSQALPLYTGAPCTTKSLFFSAESLAMAAKYL